MVGPEDFLQDFLRRLKNSSGRQLTWLAEDFGMRREIQHRFVDAQVYLQGENLDSPYINPVMVEAFEETDARLKLRIFLAFVDRFNDSNMHELCLLIYSGLIHDLKVEQRSLNQTMDKGMNNNNNLFPDIGSNNNPFPDIGPSKLTLMEIGSISDTIWEEIKEESKSEPEPKSEPKSKSEPEPRITMTIESLLDED